MESARDLKHSLFLHLLQGSTVALARTEAQHASVRAYGKPQPDNTRLFTGTGGHREGPSKRIACFTVEDGLTWNVPMRAV